VKPMKPPAVPRPANDPTILIFKFDVLQARTVTCSLDRKDERDALAPPLTAKVSNADATIPTQPIRRTQPKSRSSGAEPPHRVPTQRLGEGRGGSDGYARVAFHVQGDRPCRRRPKPDHGTLLTRAV
jgi:hypothetical protein